jgi:hypothetical protein
MPVRWGTPPRKSAIWWYRIYNRIQGAEGPRVQVKGLEFKTLEPSNPRTLEPYFRDIER